MKTSGNFLVQSESRIKPIRIVGLSVASNMAGNEISATVTELVNGEPRSRNYTIRPDDAEQMIIPDDLHLSTQHLLVGIGQVLMRLKQNGFNIEP